MDHRGLIARVPYDFDDWTLAILRQDGVEGEAGQPALVMRPADGIDPALLRFWLLFWDEICFAAWDDEKLILDEEQNDLIYDGYLRQISLSESDIAASPVLRSGPQADAAILAEMQLCAFRKLSSAEPGRWSVALDRGTSESLPERDEGRSLLVGLYDTLPVPQETVSIDRILEFREKRRAELLALRHHLEGLYQRVLDAGDGPLALATESGKLELAISDYVKALKERRFKLGGLGSKPR